jgi:thioredoxin 1
MAYQSTYTPETMSRAEADALPGAAVIEFGTNWCGFCQGAQALVARAFEGRDEVRHVKVEDGSGRPLGRSYRVKLWPTLVFLKNGVEVARVVRPRGAAELAQAFDALK